MKLRRRLGSVLLLSALVSQGARAQPDQGEAGRRLAELEQRLDEELQGWTAIYRSAATEEEREALRAEFPRQEYVDELTAIAGEAQGTDVAARAWLGVFRLASKLDDRVLFTRALERLLADHIASPEVASLSLELVYGAPPWSAQPAADALRRILAASQDASVQANCLAELALLVGLDDSFGAAGRAEAGTLLARIERDFGDQDFIGMSGKQFAAGARFEIENLRVGQVAPEFEVVDQDGVRFKLGDYRGRVVVLDFWGFV